MGSGPFTPEEQSSYEKLHDVLQKARERQDTILQSQNQQIRTHQQTIVPIQQQQQQMQQQQQQMQQQQERQHA